MIRERLAILCEDRAAMGLLAALEEAGAEARIIGGAVRNALIRAPVTDIDITTTALPERVSEIARAAGWKAVPTGIEHGTVTVVIGHRPFEVTTLREDVATDGRRAEVRFGTDFLADAARRDFTINAMAIARDGVLVDPFGGLADLAAGHVRFIGEADQRLKEDYLRGLRFLRFSAAYARGPLDAEGLAAIIRQQEGFDRLSRERVRQELLKLLVAPRAAEVMTEAEASGLLTRIVGLAPDLELFRRLVGVSGADAIIRLFALFGARPGAIDHLRSALRLSNEETRRLRALSGAASLAREGADPRLIGYRHGAEAPFGLLMAGASSDAVEAARDIPVFHLGGEDLLRAGLKPGPQIGNMLAQIEAAWIARGFPAGKTAQIALMQELLGA